MFDISMEKEPAQSLLYILLACAMGILCISHYYFGHLNILLIQLTTTVILLLTSAFLHLNQERSLNKYINLLSLTAIALLMQYQLFFNTELTMHWIYLFPMISYFALPISWAFLLNVSVMLCTIYQLFLLLEIFETLRFSCIYILIGMCSLCYAYVNNLKQKNLLKLAVTDYQSGAYNERYLTHKLKQEIARSEATNRRLSMLAVTIDDFQQIQDIHGKNMGGKLLKNFRYKLIVLLRAGDEIFHNGQGSFYILLPNCSLEGGIIIKDRLIKLLSEDNWGDVGDLQLNAGLASLNHNETAESFLNRASGFVHKQQQTALRLMSFN
ncbi:diguanylate cyclase DgcK [Oceaniserpentilla sp. 4NH20-0058]|uniref:GGDEF domain-containing protein n=1 Tax=Oceaniserpentilla sp. 4NH20-0058 TaxID=3127660 RepID=UPI00310AC905